MQYLLYGPLVAKVAQEWREQGGAPTDSWCLHLLLLLALRSLTHQLWFSYANMLFFTRRRRVVRDGVDFQQIDAEWDWCVCTYCYCSPMHARTLARSTNGYGRPPVFSYLPTYAV